MLFSNEALFKSYTIYTVIRKPAKNLTINYTAQPTRRIRPLYNPEYHAEIKSSSDGANGMEVVLFKLLWSEGYLEKLLIN